MHPQQDQRQQQDQRAGGPTGGDRKPTGPTAVDASATRGLLLALGALILLTWLLPGGTSLSRPWLLVGTVGVALLACTGAGLGVYALARRGETGLSTRGAVPAIITGSLTAVLSLVLLLSLALLWDAFGELERCRSRALVDSARSACAEGFTSDTERRLGRVSG